MKDLLQRATEAYNAAVKRMNDADDAVQAAEEGADLEALNKEVDDSIAEVGRKKAELTRVQEVAEARKANPPIVTDPAEDRGKDGDPPPRVTVKKEELTYRPDGDHSYFRDLMAAQVQGDVGAAQRLARHNKETADYRSQASDAAEKRDVTTGDPGGGGFVPPVYLADLWVELPRGGRAFADRCRKTPLPADGMTLTIPKVQSGTTVASQDGEGTAVSETDADSQVITAPVRTVAGQNDLSIQAVERTSPGFDRIVMEDLVRAYDEELDRQLHAGTGANGQHTGIRAVAGVNTVAYTDASPTAAELLPKIFDADQKIESNKVGQATHIFWHPRRAAWMASNLSSAFPLFQLNSLIQAIGRQDKARVLDVAGIEAVRDVNIATNYGAGTNEDEIEVVNMDQIFLAEGELRTRALAEVLSGTLQVRFQAYAYSAFIPHRHPKAISLIQGTGLVTPTF